MSWRCRGPRSHDACHYSKGSWGAIARIPLNLIELMCVVLTEVGESVLPAGHRASRLFLNTIPDCKTTMCTTGQVDERLLEPDDLNFLAPLGWGFFSQVTLTESKRSKKLYAVKSCEKKNVIDHDEVEHIKSERRMLLLANKHRHPFLLNLHACFQTEGQIFFVLDYIAGGDLLARMLAEPFSLDQTRLYAAEICLGLKHLHEQGVLHRNLKLSGILLDLEGHVKIRNYTYCKEDMWYGSTTQTFCGTSEFPPPEVLLDEDYGRAVDWWAYGVLFYQMLLRKNPFLGRDGEDELYDSILDDEPPFPDKLSQDSVSILRNLLKKKRDTRLGSGPTDAQEIISHDFFRDVNWEDVYHKRVQVTFKPTIKHPQDTSNFGEDSWGDFPPVRPSEAAGRSHFIEAPCLMVATRRVLLGYNHRALRVDTDIDLTF